MSWRRERTHDKCKTTDVGQKRVEGVGGKRVGKMNQTLNRADYLVSALEIDSFCKK